MLGSDRKNETMLRVACDDYVEDDIRSFLDEFWKDLKQLPRPKSFSLRDPASAANALKQFEELGAFLDLF